MKNSVNEAEVAGAYQKDKVIQAADVDVTKVCLSLLISKLPRASLGAFKSRLSSKRKKMGYAGQPMKVIKANRALLKKSNTFKKVHKMFLEPSGTTGVAFKTVSAEELALIKSEIRRKKKEEAFNRAVLLVLCIALVAYVAYKVFHI